MFCYRSAWTRAWSREGGIKLFAPCGGLFDWPPVAEWTLRWSVFQSGEVAYKPGMLGEVFVSFKRLSVGLTAAETSIFCCSCLYSFYSSAEWAADKEKWWEKKTEAVSGMLGMRSRTWNTVGRLGFSVCTGNYCQTIGSAPHTSSCSLHRELCFK